MTSRELVRAINETFYKAGLKNSWLHDQFLDLYTRRELEQFRIPDIVWFKGAADIMRMVSDLHTNQSSKEELVMMAEILGEDCCMSDAKKTVAAVVKANRNWRVAAWKLRQLERKQKRAEQWTKVYDYLESIGFQTALLPHEIEHNVWIVDSMTADGEHVKLQIALRDSQYHIDRLLGDEWTPVGQMTVYAM